MELLIPYHYQEHILRIPADQWPEEVNNAFANINQEMYVAMQGPSEFPNGSFLLCPNGSHMAMWDDPDNYANGIISFLNKTNN
tara:strand:- start:4212 stop:4460 length:249 start_codon:yes stop_codon:yes gene_type:complete